MFHLIMHPEVIICLLTLLYAGKTKERFKYLKLIKKLNNFSKLAGNKFINNYYLFYYYYYLFYYNYYYLFDTSETLCNETNNINYTLYPISVHVPKHKRPINSNDFNNYLKGLIDSIGIFSFNKYFQLYLILPFHKLDSSLAYFIKKQLSYGSIKFSSFNSSFLTLTLPIFSYHSSIYSSFDFTFFPFNSFINLPSFIKINKELINKILIKESENDNYKILGIIESLIKFKINLNWSLSFSITHYNFDILLLLKNKFGGNIKGKTLICDSPLSLLLIIKFLDNYHLLSNRHINYLKWRKSYIKIRNEEYKTEKGREKLIKLRKSMTELNKIEIYNIEKV